MNPQSDQNESTNPETPNVDPAFAAKIQAEVEAFEASKATRTISESPYITVETTDVNYTDHDHEQARDGELLRNAICIAGDLIRNGFFNVDFTDAESLTQYKNLIFTLADNLKRVVVS